MSFKDPNHGIGGSEGTIHDGGGVVYPGGDPYPGWPESPPGELGHGDGGGVMYPGGNPSGLIPGEPGYGETSGGDHDGGIMYPGGPPTIGGILPGQDGGLTYLGGDPSGLIPGEPGWDSDPATTSWIDDSGFHDHFDSFSIGF